MAGFGVTEDGNFDISPEPYGGRGSLPFHGRVLVDDPRIPPPAPDLVVMTEPGLPPILVGPSGQPVATVSQPLEEQDVPKKIGIYATRGDEFTVSVLDDGNDPIDNGSFRYPAALIVEKIKPMLEAAGHKVVDYSAGSLHEVASEGKVTTIRRSRAK